MAKAKATVTEAERAAWVDRALRAEAEAAALRAANERLCWIGGWLNDQLRAAQLSILGPSSEAHIARCFAGRQARIARLGQEGRPPTS